MTSKASNTMPKLGWAGVLPFAALAVLGAFLPVLTINAPFVDAAITVSVANIFAVYSAMILTFMAGTLWGRLLDLELRDSGLAIGLSVASNVVMLMAFALLLFGQLGNWAMTITLAGLAAGFVMLRLIERLTLDNHMPAWYVSLRWGLTIAVLVCHGILLTGRAIMA